METVGQDGLRLIFSPRYCDADVLSRVRRVNRRTRHVVDSNEHTRWMLEKWDEMHSPDNVGWWGTICKSPRMLSDFGVAKSFELFQALPALPDDPSKPIRLRSPENGGSIAWGYAIGPPCTPWAGCIFSAASDILASPMSLLESFGPAALPLQKMQDDIHTQYQLNEPMKTPLDLVDFVLQCALIYMADHATDEIEIQSEWTMPENVQQLEMQTICAATQKNLI